MTSGQMKKGSAKPKLGTDHVNLGGADKIDPKEKSKWPVKLSRRWEIQAASSAKNYLRPVILSTAKSPRVLS